MLAAIAALMLTGIVLSLAASPPVATRIGLDAFYFVNRHAMYPRCRRSLVMIAVSFLSPRQIRRLALVVFVVALALTRRDAGLRRRDQGRAALDRARRRQHPAVRIRQAGIRHPDRVAVRRIDAQVRHAGQHAGARRCSAAVVVLLVLQPDFGQTMLIALVWGALFFMAGMRLIWVAGLGGVARRRAGRRLFHRAARRQAHRPLHGPVLRRHVPGRQRDGILRARRLVRPRAGRGHGEAHPARQPCRLRLRGRGGRVRHRALPCAGVAVRLHRDPRAAARVPRSRTRSRALRRRALRSCSARSPRSTWRSICISSRPRA